MSDDGPGGLAFGIDDLYICPGCSTVQMKDSIESECFHCHYEGEFHEVKE